MFPLRDENPTLRTPYAVIAIIALNAVAWFALQGLGSDVALARSLCLYGLIPGDLLGQLPTGTQINLGSGLVCQFDGTSNPVSLLSSMFMHGGWFHIIGNMWFLWVFGDNIEDVMGPVRFVIFYLVCGLAAAGAQIMTDPSSAIPMVGASGAIGGVMGAYALLYPRHHVHTLIFLGFFATTVAVPAIFMLGYWFLLQILGGLPTIGSSGGGVAFWAHIGGFLAGLVCVHLFKRPDYMAAHQGQPARHSSRHRWF
ncbi:MAG: rhomboid family intramembrane serine protease [Pseudomonadales bacterium]|jgi:membrane associated rhomboid family serine protease|nr:rhomboid family intramembrane serine protease [Pseudomonadales bacterium]MDP6470960.1 rhomboid family intramembrane serine protease [Pseudomonadales bacterium]MDP6825855.1 rhomboid family intramembrane serine protease [Pseudomonadales bacterium]MDP6972823.1 rhomboid family intramembrane serine protease [Pseudomonadales bacterium]|tara:strand:- start:440 stop:1201 length:762 start_codon:yes stop_codon:yes gene_type:complete